jgi:hypothetical protein
MDDTVTSELQLEEGLGWVFEFSALVVKLLACLWDLEGLCDQLSERINRNKGIPLENRSALIRPLHKKLDRLHL